ncbi:antibiotic biosynthesis monooxygenase family protein [uncultured Maribacter sp.]|uniref:putative quinol monooxygenase n=1 Tax=uncultured Maribacter sp. TaxID=431308 RepID=UPI0030D76231|tara:strand:+ start:3921 stop:4349 length:429 start_codon:yes stop_codon:yes gene_type:complete
MTQIKINLSVLLIILLVTTCSTFAQTKTAKKTSNMMVRIAEIEIDSNYLDEYIAILKEESEASVRLEAGVICIYPMFKAEAPTQIRLLEIYASKEDYEAHLKTPHFLEYKIATLKMVKDLKLIEMSAIDAQSMPMIFQKLNQ